MKHFYPEYRDLKKLAPLVQEIGSRHNVVVIGHCAAPSEREYALYDARKPIGVATYEIVKRLPMALQGQLPSPEKSARILEDGYEV